MDILYVSNVLHIYNQYMTRCGIYTYVDNIYVDHMKQIVTHLLIQSS